MRYSYDQDNGTPDPASFTFNSIDTGKSFLGYDATQSGRHVRLGPAGRDE